MIKNISRDELKRKLDRGDNFHLVETLPKTAYQHAHLPSAINLPPDQVKELAPTNWPESSPSPLQKEKTKGKKVRSLTGTTPLLLKIAVEQELSTQ